MTACPSTKPRPLPSPCRFDIPVCSPAGHRAIAGAVGAYDRAGIRAEGAAASALAALPQLGDSPGPVILVVTGRNIDDALHRRAVEEPGSFSD